MLLGRRKTQTGNQLQTDFTAKTAKSRSGILNCGSARERRDVHSPIPLLTQRATGAGEGGAGLRLAFGRVGDASYGRPAAGAEAQRLENAEKSAAAFESARGQNRKDRLTFRCSGLRERASAGRGNCVSGGGMNLATLFFHLPFGLRRSAPRRRTAHARPSPLMNKKTLQRTLDAAVTAHKSGQHQEAERLYALVREGAPRLFDGWYLSGVLAVHADRPADAVPFLTHALQIDKSSAETRLFLGMALADLQRYAEAVKPLRSALEKLPDHPAAWENLAKSLAATGRSAEADECLRRVLAMQPDRADVREKLAAAAATPVALAS